MFVGPFKKRNVPLCFLFLLVFFLLKKNCKMIISSTSFFNLLFLTLHFFQHRLCRKNFMFCVFRSLLIFSFSFICFSCRFLFDFSRSPSQHASLSKCLLYLFISSFCSSSFHLFSFFVSSCFLVSFTFSHFLNFLFFLVFLLSLCFFMSNSLWKKSFYTSAKLFFFFSPQKNFVFSFSFFSCAF